MKRRRAADDEAGGLLPADRAVRVKWGTVDNKLKNKRAALRERDRKRRRDR